ncbi:hypothetical protein [Nocardiopsis alkaliphila]|uniref:hypothetical protein n=1 Tax=Nocardiopsis alkaliphila TaxID=225762 RepID=UPI00034D51BD|nr:hypothetical protein [Nocardiopsis alkaliphila]
MEGTALEGAKDHWPSWQVRSPSPGRYSADGRQMGVDSSRRRRTDPFHPGRGEGVEWASATTVA